MSLYPAERTILLISGALAVADAFLIWWKDIIISVDLFAYAVGMGFVFVAIGQIYRRYRDSERIALTMHVFGLYLVYGVAGGLFNIVLLPLQLAPIDAELVRIDAWLGYSWPAMCAWIANYPLLNVMMRTAYMLTPLQLLLSFVLLGFLLDRRRLHTALLASVISSLMVIFLWALFPSAGASAYWTLDPEIDRIVRPMVDSRHGAELYRLYREGAHDLTSASIKGLIGFPSFHTAMGIISIIAVWPYRSFRNTLLVFGIFLAPAILIHGGHNLVDVIAGAAITVVAWRVSAAIYDAQERIRLATVKPVASAGLPEATAA